MPRRLTSAQVAASSTWTDPDVVRVLAVADTQVPARARDLPPLLWQAVAVADLVLHAGDWVAPELLDELERRATRLPTDRRRQPACTYLTFALRAGSVEDVVLHRLPPRTARRAPGSTKAPDPR